MHMQKRIATCTEEGLTLTERILGATIIFHDMQIMHEETDNTPVYGN